jgi:hypothetical protein
MTLVFLVLQLEHVVEIAEAEEHIYLRRNQQV